ncbi:GIN domain-containing protein [Flagellimonas beolgyonensis]|uniref:GIN domain-containing protein n=1 Tax=Flagellimonas beolgyonensis TaxID=864064 RepID=UPI003D64ED4A
MKKILLLIVVVFPLLCNAQRKPRIKGSRIVTEVNGELPAFNAIALNDNLDINIKRSYGPGYSVVADDNLIDILKFNVQDSTLVISSYYDVTAKKKFEITINYTELKAITLKDGSLVAMDIIESDELFVDGFNNSRLDIKANAAVMDINLEDTVNANFNVDVDSLNITMGGRSEAYVYAVNETALLDQEGNASLTMEGTSDRIQAQLIGNAKYRGEGMEVGSLKLTIANDASARCYAYRDFELSAKGNTNTYLYGTPKISILEFLDTTQLIKKQE